MQTFSVVIKVGVEDNVDMSDFAHEMDYEIDYPGVVSTEVINVTEKPD